MDSIWIILIIIALLLVWSLVRRKNTATPKLDAAIGVITDVNTDLRIVEIRQADPKSKKKFSNGNWRRFEDKLIFLDASVISSLKEAFTLVEDFNSRIEVKGLLSDCKKGLAEWLKANMQSELQNTKRRTWLGF